MLSDSDSSVPVTKQKQVASKQAPKKVTKKQESDDSSSDEDVKFLNVKKGREETKTTKAPAKKQAVESDDESSEVKPKNGTKKPVGKKVADSDSESEKKPVAKAQAKKAPVKKQESDSDDESEEVPKKTTQAKKAPVKKQDSDSDDDESEEAPKKTTQVAKKAPVKKQDSDEDEESEEEAPKKTFQKAQPQESNSGCKELFLKNLSWNTDDNKLWEFFAKYGTVENVKVLYDKNTGKARGLAFVEFSSRSEAQACLDDAASLEVDGRTLQATFSDQKDANRGPQQGGQQQGGRSFGNGGGYTPSNYDGERHTIFVGNLGFKSTEQSVKNFFKDCGNVVDVRIAKDRDTGKSKGFCHVDFDASNAVEKAKGKAGEQLDGREIRVDASQPRQGGSGGGRGGSGGRGGFRGGRGGGRGGSFNPMDRAKKSGALMQPSSNSVVTFDDDE
jgi:nucleolin